MFCLMTFFIRALFLLWVELSPEVPKLCWSRRRTDERGTGVGFTPVCASYSGLCIFLYRLMTLSPKGVYQMTSMNSRKIDKIIYSCENLGRKLLKKLELSTNFRCLYFFEIIRNISLLHFKWWIRTLYINQDFWGVVGSFAENYRPNNSTK